MSEEAVDLAAVAPKRAHALAGLPAQRKLLLDVETVAMRVPAAVAVGALAQ